MKKHILSLAVLALLAAGCANQPVNKTGNTPPQAQNPTTGAKIVPVPTKHVSISVLSPSSGPVNTQIIITGQGFAKTGNLIMFGSSAGRHHQDGTADNVISKADSGNGTTLSFSVPAEGPSGILCDSANNCIGIAAIMHGAGPYNVSVQNSNGTSNVKTFTVTVNNQSRQPAILQLNPSSGPVGTQVTILGSNFTASGNTVNFSPGATVSNISSSAGSSLQFDIPVTGKPPKCPRGAMCVPLGIYPSTYNLSVTNTNGTSNVLPFTVTQ